MRTIDAHALLTAYEDAMKELVQATNVENISLEALSLLCGAKLIAEAPTVDNWTSVKDKLPECSGRYICRYKQEVDGKYCACTDFGSYDADREENGGWYTGEVTHWMPLPEPPKEEHE